MEDKKHTDGKKPETESQLSGMAHAGIVTIRSLIWGVLMSGIFAFLTVFLENRRSMIATANQVPLFPYLMLVFVIVLINPIARLIRIVKPFSVTELMLIFAMTMVTSGISTFGLTSQFLPIMSGLFNKHWNNGQSEWCTYVEPYVNESMFISEKGISRAASEYAKEFQKLQEMRERGEEAEAQEAIVNQKRSDLAKLEEAAFAKVEIYRRGLPAEKRAIPGILFTTDDTPQIYFRRLGRLRAGLQAAKSIKEAQASKSPQGLEKALATLKPFADDSYAREHIAFLDSSSAECVAQISDINAKVLKLNQDKREDTIENMRRMENEIAALDKQHKRLEGKIKHINKQKECYKREITICQRVATACGNIEVIAKSISVGEDAWAGTDDVLAAFPTFDASISRYLIGEVPWSHWAKPLFHWAIVIFVAFVVLYTFNILIFRQWAHHEKLIFPLAELPESIVGIENGKLSTDVVPQMFKNGLFWIGFIISASVMGWNLLANTEIIPGLNEMNLNTSWTPYVRNSMFKALAFGASSTIFFTLIGLSFLIPQKVSFSLWFFHIFYFVLLMALVAFGYGQNVRSFRQEWWYIHNFRSAMGTGALIVFAIVVIWKSRDIIMCAMRPKGLVGIAPDEARELRNSSFIFMASSLVLILLLWLMLKINIIYSIFGYLVIMVTTIGLIRSVAEGGMLSIHSNASPFHLIRDFCGMDKPYSHPHLFAPLMIFYSILFLDLKTFIAPSMATGFKICDDLKMSRRRYHTGIALSIIVATVVSVITAIIIGYYTGADAMHTYFYTFFPRSTYNLITSLSKVPPEQATGQLGWLIAGVILMAILLFFRQNHFWLPHPIGMIMLVNPHMSGAWFSIMLGWLAKSLVTRYSDKNTYTQIKGLFIGLILGEFTVILISLIISYIMERPFHKISLNRF